MKVLLIEDDPLITRLYINAFTQAGFVLETALDGEEGLQKAKLVTPDIILLDIMMPKINGIQVLENLKADAVTKAIPVVMTSNLSTQQDMENAFSKGAIEFLVKSEYEPADVVKRTNEILTATLKAIPQNAKPLNSTT